jgi:two-component system, OmpR family, sensor kinase
VGGERLTRQELGWLLAQEARGAAKSLRAEVTELRASLPPKRPEELDRSSSLPAEKSLNALDEAIALLGKLETGSKSRTRRGRIDLAALLFEIAPECRLEIEPGAGTEVVGDEQELGRMLHLLLSTQNSGLGDSRGARSVRIRREGSWINISVDLGPEAGASSELERRWLSRMAVRHGGKLELRGRQQAILLPAEASNKEEVDGLRRELFEAQQLGETYARELASMLGAMPTASAPAGAAASRLDIVRAMACAILPTLQHANAQLSGSNGSPTTSPSSQGDGGLRDLIADLSSVTNLRAAEGRRVDLRNSVHAAIGRCQKRAQRKGIELVAGVLDPCPIEANVELLDALVRSALEHAVSASPHDFKLTVELRNVGGEAYLTTHDGGPPIPVNLTSDLLEQRIDAGSLGRPAGLSLLLVHAIVEPLGGQVTFSARDNGNVTEIHLPLAG